MESQEGKLGNLGDLFKPREQTGSVNGVPRIRTHLPKVMLS